MPWTVDDVVRKFSWDFFVTSTWLYCAYPYPLIIKFSVCIWGRSQWPRGLRRRSAVTRLLILWVWIPMGAWMFVYCECCVLAGRGLRDGLIPRPEESYRLWCVVVCDLEISWMRRPWPTGGLLRQKQTNKQTNKAPFTSNDLYFLINLIL